MSDPDPASPVPRCTTVLPPGGPADDAVDLDYDARFLRRKRLVGRAGLAVLVDLPEAVSLPDGAILLAETGLRLAVCAAPEPLLEIRGDLPRLAWHVGNRHTPCEIRGDHLRIRADHVLADMLRRLGADLTAVEAPFTPEGGAYGHGRTFGHDHGPSDAHDHAHAHDHPHAHDPAAPHSHGHG